MANVTDNSYKIHKKFLDIKNLKKGWFYGKGEPISKEFIDNAIKIDKLSFYNGLFKTDIFPGSDGEICVSIYYCNHYLEIILESDNTVTYSHEFEDKELEYKEEMSLNYALNKIVSFRASYG